MVLFWLIIVLMLVVALSFVVVPLLFLKQETTEDDTQIYQVLHDSNVAELKKNYDHNEISYGEYRKSKSDLDHTLVLEAASAVCLTPSQTRSLKRHIILFFAVVLPLLSIVFFVFYGQNQQWLRDYPLAQQYMKEMSNAT